MNMCLRYNPMVFSTVIFSLHGMRTDILVQSWSVMVRTELLPCDSGSFVIKLRAIVLIGKTSGFGYMGCNDALMG
jgi:hypothetical protein